MSYLTAAVVLIGILGIANLLIMLALARRMREYGDLLSKRITAGSGRPPAYRLPPGTKVAEFAAATLNGGDVSLDSLSGSRMLAGFFSPRCGPCHEQVPAFTDLAKSVRGRGEQVLAVVAGQPDDTAEFAAGLNDDAIVVVENPQGPVSSAFSVHGWPSFYWVDPNGTVESSAPTVAMLMPALAAS